MRKTPPIQLKGCEARLLRRIRILWFRVQNNERGAESSLTRLPMAERRLPTDDFDALARRPDWSFDASGEDVLRRIKSAEPNAADLV